MSRSVSFVVALALTIAAAQGCVWLYGTSPEIGTAHWNHRYHGLDWEDGVCATGTHQSPMNFDSDTPVLKGASKWKTTWDYPALVSNGSNVEVWNSGHTIQVQWSYNYAAKVKIQTAGGPNATVLDPVNFQDKGTKVPETKTVQAVPIQFHFHAQSEHTFDGNWGALELHIVHRVYAAGCGTDGCLSVTGILFKLADRGTPLLDEIFDHAPEFEGEKHFFPAGTKLEVNSLLPKNRQFVMYSGSLTTPPCTEGLLWHVFTHELPISREQLNRYHSLVGEMQCDEIHPANGTDAHAAHKHHHHHHHRRMLSETTATTTTAPETEYNCTLAAHGWNNRWPMDHGARHVYRFG